MCAKRDTAAFGDYLGFVEKFQPKKTTDDCYTPAPVYDAVLGWAAREYGIGSSACTLKANARSVQACGKQLDRENRHGFRRSLPLHCERPAGTHCTEPQRHRGRKLQQGADRGAR